MTTATLLHHALGHDQGIESDHFRVKKNMPKIGGFQSFKTARRTNHSTINRWVLAYAPLIEKRLRQFRRPHCGSIRIDETYVNIRGKWRYLYRAIDKNGNPVDFLLTARRDLDAAKRFFRKMLKDEPLLSPEKIGTDGANTFPSAIKTSVDNGLLHPDPVHYGTKHLQQGIDRVPGSGVASALAVPSGQSRERVSLRLAG